jgi:hypothetical protein
LLIPVLVSTNLHGNVIPNKYACSVPGHYYHEQHTCYIRSTCKLMGTPPTESSVMWSFESIPLCILCQNSAHEPLERWWSPEYLFSPMVENLILGSEPCGIGRDRCMSL